MPKDYISGSHEVNHLCVEKAFEDIERSLEILSDERKIVLLSEPKYREKFKEILEKITKLSA